MAIAIGILTIAATRAIETQQRDNLLHTVDADIAGLTDIMVQGGVSELTQRIADRTQLAPQMDQAAYYFLADSTGHRIAGNLASLPRVDAAHSEFAIVDTSDGQMILRATRLRGDLTLAVARSLSSSAALVWRLQIVFLTVALPAILASMGAAAIVASRFRNRVAVLNTIFAQFDRGQRQARAGMDGSLDELADLARHVDIHLDRIEQLLTAQREISDNIAHELRTPLVHLDMRLIRAIDRSTDNSILSELENARQDIRSIVLLFDSLLDIALAETQAGIGSDETPFDVSELAANLAELYAASAEELGLDFTTRISSGVTMRGEPMAITRMIANLLDNAFKFVPRGARVRLTVSEGPKIIVDDNGPGIGAADSDRIFVRFHRARASGTGHGLGLALVRIIAARHGLSSRYEDARPGARFIIDRTSAA